MNAYGSEPENITQGTTRLISNPKVPGLVILSKKKLYYSWLRIYRPAPGSSPQPTILIHSQCICPDQAGVRLCQAVLSPWARCWPHCQGIPCYFLQYNNKKKISLIS